MGEHGYVEDIFESKATDTNLSHCVWPRRMLYMSISAPGEPTVWRSQISAITPRLCDCADDGSIPNDNPYFGRPGFKLGVLLRSSERAWTRG
jgi:hypothetical protein